ncbi:MAG: hypothetical protein Q9183_002144 [Haloplaca sp. 2 TL-2023]
MQYVRSIGGSVSKTWNSINPATLSGAIDVIVVELEDEFKVNGVKQNHAMKLGEGGEAFFVFETSDQIPESLQTSPVVSPAASPHSLGQDVDAIPSLQEPDFLDINFDATSRKASLSRPSLAVNQRAQSDYVIPDAHLLRSSKAGFHDSGITPASSALDGRESSPSGAFATAVPPISDAQLKRSASAELLTRPSPTLGVDLTVAATAPTTQRPSENLVQSRNNTSEGTRRSASPPPLSTADAIDRAKSLSKKLSMSKIRSRVTESGDLMLDMTGYKTNEDEALRAEGIARKILAEELEGNQDIGALIGADMQGNLWIYSSEEAKDAAREQIRLHDLTPQPIASDSASDPGLQSDSEIPPGARDVNSKHQRAKSDTSPNQLMTPPHTPPADTSTSGDPNRNYAKTLRLTSDQLKALDLKPGSNTMSFSVNRATCTAYMYYWTHHDPIVISDIDGTITKSDALGHVLNMIGRDWTHVGVAKLYTDIVANGYNILYLTSRSVGQADTTRAYLSGVSQEGFKLPKGPVIMSPDRTIAALRREIYLRKPEVFKMACLRDILNLFGHKRTPFYAGFGNRLTDALSYRSVNIPSTRIFTINSNAEVSLDLLTLNKYKNSYVTMRELVDHFFPPIGLLVTSGGEEFTDFNYWRETPLDLDEFSDSDDSDGNEESEKQSRRSIGSEDEGSEGLDDDDQTDPLAESYITQASADESERLADSLLESAEGQNELEIVVAEDDSGRKSLVAVDPKDLTSNEVKVELVNDEEASRAPGEQGEHI